MHSFDYQGFIIWGLTASILINVAQLALGRSAEFVVYAKGEEQQRMQREHEQEQQQQGKGGQIEQQQQRERQEGFEEGPVAPDPELDGEGTLSTL